MFSERKPKFRSRKLDFNRSLPVYRYDEVDDLDDFDSPLRSVAQVATGVDKEEEEEHHLRQALSHQSTKTQPYYIPTPETRMSTIDDYDSLYPPSYRQSKAFGKLSASLASASTTMPMPMLSPDDPFQRYPKYNADHLDESFIASLRANGSLPGAFDVTTFEWIIDCVEDTAHKFSETVVTPESLERLRDKHAAALPADPILGAIIEYWRERRRQKSPLISHLKHEDLGKVGADPYVCFRRRELKLPRKTRRSDAQIAERLKKLHLDLSTMRLVLQAAVKRDRYKREALSMEGDLFERYRLIDNWRRHNKTEWPPHLPTFKTAAQSLLETKKKRSRHEAAGADASVGGGAGGRLDASGSYKIAIPVSVLRGSRHARPYYPHEVGRQIQRDLDSILGQGHELHDNRVNIDDLCPFREEEELSG